MKQAVILLPAFMLALMAVPSLAQVNVRGVWGELDAVVKDPDFAEFHQYVYEDLINPMARKGYFEGKNLPEVMKSMIEEPELTARAYGYALGLQLKFVEKGKESHEIWKHLEEKTTQFLEIISKNYAQAYGIDTEEMRNRVLGQMRAANLGSYDAEMAYATGIDPKKNFSSIIDKIANKANLGLNPGSSDITPHQYLGIWRVKDYDFDGKFNDTRTIVLSTVAGDHGYRTYNFASSYWEDVGDRVKFVGDNGRTHFTAKRVSPDKLVGSEADGWKYELERITPATASNAMPGIFIYTIDLKHFQEVFTISEKRFMGAHILKSLIPENENSSHFLENSDSHVYVASVKRGKLYLTGWGVKEKKKYHEMIFEYRGDAIYQDTDRKDHHLIQVSGPPLATAVAANNDANTTRNTKTPTTSGKKSIEEKREEILINREPKTEEAVKNAVSELYFAAINFDEPRILRRLAPPINLKFNTTFADLKNGGKVKGLTMKQLRKIAPVLTLKRISVSNVAGDRAVAILDAKAAFASISGNKLELMHDGNQWRLFAFTPSKGLESIKSIFKMLEGVMK